MGIRRLLLGISFFVCGLRALSQPVDWTGDMTLFGTAGNESLPAMSARPASARLHAFCVCGVTLCSKTSNNAGADWSGRRMGNTTMLS